MGIISTLVAARWLAKRAERRRVTQARGASLQTGARCNRCADSLVLSVDWPGIDPVYWEDWLQGICSNCYDNDVLQARGAAMQTGTPGSGSPLADGHAWPPPVSKSVIMESPAQAGQTKGHKVKHKVVLRWPSEAVISYVVEADTEAELAERVSQLAYLGDADGVTEIHRFDELTGNDAAVVVNEPMTF